MVSAAFSSPSKAQRAILFAAAISFFFVSYALADPFPCTSRAAPAGMLDVASTYFYCVDSNQDPLRSASISCPTGTYIVILAISYDRSAYFGSCNGTDGISVGSPRALVTSTWRDGSYSIDKSYGTNMNKMCVSEATDYEFLPVMRYACSSKPLAAGSPAGDYGTCVGCEATRPIACVANVSNLVCESSVSSCTRTSAPASQSVPEAFCGGASSPPSKRQCTELGGYCRYRWEVPTAYFCRDDCKNSWSSTLAPCVDLETDRVMNDKSLCGVLIRKGCTGDYCNSTCAYEVGYWTPCGGPNTKAYRTVSCVGECGPSGAYGTCDDFQVGGSRPATEWTCGEPNPDDPTYVTSSSLYATPAFSASSSSSSLPGEDGDSASAATTHGSSRSKDWGNADLSSSSGAAAGEGPSGSDDHPSLSSSAKAAAAGSSSSLFAASLSSRSQSQSYPSSLGDPYSSWSARSTHRSIYDSRDESSLSREESSAANRLSDLESSTSGQVSSAAAMYTLMAPPLLMLLLAIAIASEAL
jgi:hypothetical protein